MAESADAVGPDAIFERTDPVYPWRDLLRLGGFPEPLLGGSEAKAHRWSRLRLERLVREDLRDLRAVCDLQAVRVLADLLPERAAGLLSVNALREDVGVAYATVRAWLAAFEALYLLFLVRPHGPRIARAARGAEALPLRHARHPASRLGARRENLVALHLLKACHQWTDAAAGEFELRYVRDKEKREVDFLVLRDRRPWLMVECKSNDVAPSPHLIRFATALEVPLRFQLVDRPGFDRVYAEPRVRVLDPERFLAGLA